MTAYKGPVLSQAMKDDYERSGYVFVPRLINDSELPRLQEACDRVVAKTRAGEWPHRRIVGKQFPPFVGDEPDSWGVQHIMHPDLHEPAFVRWYGSEGVVGAATSLLGCKEEEVQMGESRPVNILGLLRTEDRRCPSVWYILQNSLIFLLTRTDTHSHYDGTEMMSPKRLL